MTTKALEINLGVVGAAQNPGTVGVPVVEPGVVLASGYYIEETSGQDYYYYAPEDQWYYVTAAGLLYALELSWAPSPSVKIDLSAGDTLRFNLTFKYMGPAVTKTFYAAIGNNSKTGDFFEWSGFTNSPGKSISIPAKTTPTLITGEYLDIVVPAGEAIWDHHGEDGGAYCKILNGFTLIQGENCTPLYYDVCHIIPAAGEFSDFGITSFVKV